MALCLNIFSIFSLLNFHSEGNAQTPQLDLISFALSFRTRCLPSESEKNGSVQFQVRE